MTASRTTRPFLRPLGLATLSAGLFAAALSGCKTRSAAPTDAALANTVQTEIGGDSALAGQPIQSSVQAGVVTLSGSVSNPTQRTVAARDAAGVAGVKEVINHIGLAEATVTTAPLPSIPTAPPAPVPARAIREATARDAREHAASLPQPAPIERRPPAEGWNANGQPGNSQGGNSSSYAQSAPLPPPVQQTPPPPPQPVFRSVTVPAGDSIAVRVTQTLDSGSSQAGDSFSGVVASDVMADGAVAIPAGSAVTGSVTDVKDAAHFKGSSLLTVSLTSISRRGERLPVSADPYTLEGKGRGKNTAEKTGGGAAVGAILGGIFGGGKGAAIGAGAGAGVGAGTNAVTRGQQVSIPSETVVRFQLAAPFTVRVRADGATRGDAGLQPR